MATKSKVSLASLGLKKVEEAAGIVEYRMKNGLKILLRENHSAPVVSFMVVYRVGSRNEAVGYTGSTHFLEHMMFKGTRKFNPQSGSGVMETFSRIGALLNATTWLDRTNYFECVPSEYLELCIQVEADRMRNLNLRQEDRDSEMTVVRNEFERGENNPGSALSKEVVALAFREHPYHHPTIGWRSDVESVPLARMKEFYDTYYWPNNATVIVVGDFDSDETLRKIHKHFGKIEKSAKPIPEVYTVEPPQEGERRVELRRAGDLPQLLIAYHTPEADHDDNFPLSVMHAILGDSGRRSSRLYKALLEKGLATSCYASNGEFRDPFLFSLGATLAPGSNFAELEEAIYAEIKRLAEEDVTDEELQRVKSANRKGTILGSADPQTFANMLCGAESVASWKWLVDYDERYDRVTAADVRRVAAKYFESSNRTVGHFIPTDRNGKDPSAAFNEKKLDTSTAKSKTAVAKKIDKRRLELAKPGSSGSDFEKRVHKQVLANGLTILVLPNPGTGSIAIHGALAAGDCFGSLELSTLPTLTSNMLTRGSENYSKEKLAQILEEMGIRFGFGADRFKVGFGTLLTREDFPAFLPVLSDLLRKPLFPEDELSLLLKEMNAGLTRAMNDTGRRASNALMQALYPPGHAFYDRSYEERLLELERITKDDLQRFHSAHYGPSGSVITVVGDIDADEAISLLKDAFSDWQGPARKEILLAEVP
ncbi:MAG: insulinase family protein, partial [Candidatus Obscuribacterales bacterium]|nr:insulinase family protein [Candidatus Obscuribacterales bacterium]